MSRLLPLLEASESGYYSWLKRSPSKRALDNLELDTLITDVFNLHEARYGYRRIYVELLEDKVFSGSRERIRRRMKHLKGLLHNVQWMSCNPILSGFGRSIESHSGDYGSIFSFQRHQSGAANRRYDIMQQTLKA